MCIVLKDEQVENAFVFAPPVDVDPDITQEDMTVLWEQAARWDLEENGSVRECKITPDGVAMVS